MGENFKRVKNEGAPGAGGERREVGENSVMIKDDSVFTRLRRGAEEFSSMQQVVCAYILENYQRVAFMTVEELAGLCGASPATVVRTVKALDYESFHEMQGEFEKLLMSTQVSLWWELERSWEEKTEDDFPLPWIAKDNIDAIQDSLTPQLVDNFRKASDMLANARRIFIVGMRSSKACALFFQSMLNQLFSNAEVATDGGETLFDYMVDLGPEDVLFCISLGGPHYAKSTAGAVAFAARNGIPSILVSSSPTAPSVEFATLVLYVASTQKHYSIVPCLTLLEALIVSLGQRNREKAQKKLRKLEDILVKESVTY